MTNPSSPADTTPVGHAVPPATHTRRSPGPVLVLLTLPLSLSAFGCGGSKHVEQGARPPVPVTVAKVERKAIPIAFRAIGNVEAVATVAVKARIGGELLRIPFREGDPVQRGDALFVIDARPYRAALAQAEAMLARDQALLTKAESDVTRYADLVKQDYVTKEQYDQIIADAASLKASVAADEAALETARLNLEYCTITAPVTGRTGTLNVKAGDLIKPNDDTPMVTINQTTPIFVSFSVSAQLLPSVLAHRKDGISVVASIPDETVEPPTGRLTFVDNAVDTTTSTILLKATFPNREEILWPGQYVDLTVILGEETDRVVCPASAVQTGQQGRHVFVVKNDNTVELRAVQVDRVNDNDAVIDSGLTSGETVVTDGQLRLVPGSTVEIKTAQQPAGTPP